MYGSGHCLCIRSDPDVPSQQPGSARRALYGAVPRPPAATAFTRCVAARHGVSIPGTRSQSPSNYCPLLTQGRAYRSACQAVAGQRDAQSVKSQGGAQRATTISECTHDLPMAAKATQIAVPKRPRQGMRTHGQIDLCVVTRRFVITSCLSLKCMGPCGAAIAAVLGHERPRGNAQVTSPPFREIPSVRPFREARRAGHCGVHVLRGGTCGSECRHATPSGPVKVGGVLVSCLRGTRRGARLPRGDGDAAGRKLKEKRERAPDM